MEDIKIKIRPFNKSNKKDKVMARILEDMANQEKEKFNGIIDSVIRIQLLLEKVYGIVLPIAHWNNLLSEVIKLNLRNNIERDLK